MTNSDITPKTRRKRSGRVALTTMAALGGGALLSGCGEAAAEQAKAPMPVASAQDGEEVQVFENVFACAKETGMTRAECAEKREEALAIAEKEAPRFEALADCEQQFGEGKCQESPSDTTSPTESRRGPSFMPFLVGYMWGKSSTRPAPAFSSPGGGYQTSRGVRLGYAGAPGKYYAGSRAFQPARSVPKVKAASAMAKKAGFGETSRGWSLNSRAGRTATASSRGG
ncbi:DUF1190 domain-containing protein [Qipengyuania aurantiaca]|uniref:DUF1190 domain-containing protein n=1 Tax=Qipengyuania aurantiaca TaxID=2867233 RepID=A0ABX8ZPJ6_9SPHN|nr:DUF1190 domain-containing protein [Qipengyuania aurantiaca]QZD89103.1 DUF1190 domain-containing protein [Qipengyuania aurantiaca]